MNIIEIAHLVEYLCLPSDNVSKSDKVKEIKCAMKNGVISSDDALELVLEYIK